MKIKGLTKYFLGFVMTLLVGGVMAQEITVKGGGIEIPDGTNTWGAETGTSFGVINAANGSITRTFWILNTATSGPDLTVATFDIRSGNTLGGNAYDAQFTLVDPTTLSIPFGDSVSFTVTFDPTAEGTYGRTTAGSQRAWVRFTSNDIGTFNFAISGIGIDGTAFDCSTGPLIQITNGANEFNFDYSTDPPTRASLGSTENGTAALDGVGINPLDSLLYGIRYTASNRNQLWAMGHDGDPVFVGYLSGDGVTAGSGQHHLAGTFDDAGYLYTFKNGLNDEFYRIDVRSQVSSQIDLTESIRIRDMVFNPGDGLFYAYSYSGLDGLVSIDPTDGTVTLIGGDGDELDHGMFVSSTGEVYVMDKNTDVIQQVDLTTGARINMHTDPGFGNPNWMDLASCGAINFAPTAISVAGNGIEISHGDVTPDYPDGTNMGAIIYSAGGTSQVFWIRNPTTSTVTLTDTVASSKTQEFTITQPSSTTIAPGDSISFTVNFDPQTVGNFKTTLITIPNDAIGVPNYQFNVSISVLLSLDADSDGVTDDVDLDDDNDGILDVDEGCAGNGNGNGPGEFSSEIFWFSFDDPSLDDGVHEGDTQTVVLPNGAEFQLTFSGISGGANKLLPSEFQTFAGANLGPDYDLIGDLSGGENSLYNRASAGMDATFTITLDTILDLIVADPERMNVNGGTGDVREMYWWTTNDGDPWEFLDWTPGNQHSLTGINTTQVHAIGQGGNTAAAIVRTTNATSITARIKTTGSTQPGRQGIAIGVYLYCAGEDYDGDGVFNHLDLDSDADGCIDAQEGGDELSDAQVDFADSTVLGGVGADGIPLLVGTGQTVNISQNENADAIACCTLDSDGDGLCDIIDLDDDDDGILDEDENCPQTIAGVPARSAFLFQRENPGDPMEIYAVDLRTGDTTFLAQTSFYHNGLAYNDADGLFWGTRSNNTNGFAISIDRIDPETWTVVGSLAYTPGTNVLSGAYDPAGKNYVIRRGIVSGQHQLRIYDADPDSPGYGTLKQSFNNNGTNSFPDIAYNALDSMMYGINNTNGNLMSINLTTGVRTDLGVVSGLEFGTTGDGYGAIYSTVDGKFYLSNNRTGNIFLVDMAVDKNTATLFSAGPASSGNDGAKPLFVGVDGECFFDTDGDGDPDYLDLDSDNDGCIDAIEGDSTFSYAHVDPDSSLIGAVDTNGVPIIANGGQGIGSSQDSLVNGCCPGLVITNPADVCAPATVDLTAPGIYAGSADTSGAVWRYWSNAAATIPVPDSTSVGAGTYYVTVFRGGCEDTAAIVVTVNSRPNLVITDPTAVCAPGTVDLTASSVTSGSTNAGTLTYFSDSLATSPYLFETSATTGRYFIVATSNGCTDTAGVTATVNVKPDLAITQPSAVCFPETVDLTGTVGGTNLGTNSYYVNANGTGSVADETFVGDGTYYVVSLTGAGCSDTTQINVTVNATPDLSITQPTAVCSPETVDLTGTVGGTNLGTNSYYVNANGTGAVTDETAAGDGTYYVVSLTGAGCSDTAQINVTVNITPDLSVSQPTAVCSPETIDLTGTVGGTNLGTNSYYNNANGTGAVADETAAGNGTYYVVSLTGNGCSDTVQINAVINDKPDLMITNPDAVCEGGAVDLTQASITAGSTNAGALTYWLDANATNPVTNASAVDSGSYFIVTVNSDNCSDTAEVIATVNLAPDFTVTGNNPTACATATGDFTIEGLAINTDYFIAYNGSDDTLFTSNGSGQITVGNLVAGGYTNVTVTSIPEGCSDTDAGVTLSDPGAPSVDAGLPQFICEGESVILSATNPDGAVITWDNSVDDGVSFVPSGTLTYTATASLAGCVSSDDVTVTVNPTPSLVITQPVAVCDPERVDLNTAVGGTNLGANTFYTDANATSVYGTPTAADSGTYYVVSVSDSSCSSDTMQIDVVVNAKPELIITDPTPLCAPDSFSLLTISFLTGSTDLGSSYALNFFEDSLLTTQYLNLSSADSGRYWVHVETTTGCYDTAALNVVINTLPVFDVEIVDASSCGASDGGIRVSGLMVGSDYTVSFDGGVDSTYTADALGQLIYGGLGAGTYSNITLTKLPEGCSTTTDPSGLTLNDPGAPAVDAGLPQVICEGEEVMLHASNPDTANITWDNGVLDSVSFTPGVGSILYTVTAEKAGCIATDTVRVTVNLQPTVDAGLPQTICEGTPVTLTADNPQNANISWDNGVVNGVAFTPSVGSVLYTVNADLNGCSDSDTVRVTVNENAVLVITDPEALCGDGTVDLTASSVTTGSSNVNSLLYYTDAAATTTLVDPTAVGEGTYYIVANSSEGCASDTLPVTVTINEPEIIIEGNDQLITNGQTNTSVDDSTDFGDTHIANVTTSVTYSIINVGDCELVLDSLISTDTNFVITYISDTTIDGGDTSFVTITFDPDVLGLDTSTIVVYNTDSVYTFNTTGNGTGDPDITVIGNNTLITDGQLITSFTDSTNFGNVDIDTAFNTNTFWITNDGYDTLFITDIQSDNSDFILDPFVPDTLLPGDSISFTITFNPSDTGTQTSLITIINNDPDEDPFTFLVSGNGTVVLDPIVLYEGFSPDGNSQNDFWSIDNIEQYPDNEVLIFNRWGNLVWQGEGYDNDEVVWTGEANQGIVIGDRLPDGTYYYVVDVVGQDGETQSYQGYVIIATDR